MLKLFFLTISLLSFFGCNYNHVKSSTAQSMNEPVLTSLSLEFSSVQNNVFATQCLRCHSSASGNQGGLNLEGYPQIRANMNKIYYRSIEKKDMPPNPLSTQQYTLLKSWLEAGAPEKDSGQNLGPIQGPITWLVIKRQVLGASCLDCHSGANADGNLNLDSAEVVRKNITQIFDSALIKQTMPIQPYPTMSEAQKQALMKWISQGMPD